jgi:hypothetical protein
MVGIVGRIDEEVPTFDRCVGELPMHLPRRVRVGEPVPLPVGSRNPGGTGTTLEEAEEGVAAHDDARLESMLRQVDR